MHGLMIQGQSIGSAWRRHRALVRLVREATGGNLLAKSGRVSAWYVAVTHAALLIWLSRVENEHDLSFVLVRALMLLTFAAGLLALGTAAAGSEDAASDLGRARGATSRELELARTLAAFESAARPVFLCGVIVALTALVLSSSFAAAFGSALRMLGAGGYAVLVGVLLGLPARWAPRISPRHPRVAYLVLVLGPEVARALRDEVPSIAAVLSRALDGIAALAGGIG